ncbi:MAG: four helix bundle protein [Chloroherpetonaceae bacterium]|nr:four helix bundle protein [Chloroherpetonaceae bacterium]
MHSESVKMTSDELKARTKQFALRIIKLTEALPKTMTADVIGRQLLRSATSVAANYRSACRARSRADFVSKITVVEEEADETMFWLELIVESGLMSENRLADLYKEAKELTAIFTASGRTAKHSK